MDQMDDAAKVREKIDIVSLISGHIALKKVGRNFTTNCPFHNEKTPSFVVSPERQIWHCFGCGKGGDAFSFLMEYEGMEFLEALRVLAQRVGVRLSESPNLIRSSQKEKLYELNAIAKDFYGYLLLSHKIGQRALEYLIDERGLNKEIVKSFGLGFAPISSSTLSSYLIVKKKYKKEDLFTAGLSYQRGGKVLDFFRGRIMFPLTDARGNILGFSGRVFRNEENSGPKYINTKDTLIYHKGKTFFGLDRAKEEIKKQNSAIIMEGEFDVISSFKEGIKNVVGIKGTALTQDQALILSRITEKIILCLDKDLAGLEATKRSLSVLEKNGLSSFVSVIEEGKDPDDAIRINPILFKKSIKKPLPAYDFLINEIIKRNDKESAEGKRRITAELLPALALIENEIVREHYLKKLSKELNISIEAFVKQLEKSTKKDMPAASDVKKEKRERREILEEYFLALLLQAEDVNKVLEKVRESNPNYKFKIKAIGHIFEKTVNTYQVAKNIDLKIFSKTLQKEFLEAYNKSFLIPLPSFETIEAYTREAVSVSNELKVLYLKERIKEISYKIKELSEEDIGQKEKLKKEFTILTGELASL